MFLSQSELKRLESFKGRVQDDPRFIGIVMYGSALRSFDHQDIDIAMISKKPPLSDREKLDFIVSAPNGFDVRFLEDFPLNIAKDVIKGDLLLNQDYDEIFERYVKIIREWQLFQPAFDVYLEASRIGI